MIAVVACARVGWAWLGLAWPFRREEGVYRSKRSQRVDLAQHAVRVHFSLIWDGATRYLRLFALVAREGRTCALAIIYLLVVVFHRNKFR